ncbi:hypothetical protein ES708_20980 [subsurface metagenome]
MKKVLVLSLALIILLGIMSGGTSSYFSDTETSAGNTFTAWVEVCPPDSMIIVSDTNTMVTEVKGQPTPPPPQNAVLAWEHGTWNSSLIYNTTPYTFSDGAQWIWETYETDDPGASAPIDGRVVRFVRTFEIPCWPVGADLYITVDNGYTVWINGYFVGCAQVDPCIGWETTDLTEPYVYTGGWETVKYYPIPASYLIVGTNTLEILAANEQMDGGNATSNPAGLIYWLEVEWGY